MSILDHKTATRVGGGQCDHNVRFLKDLEKQFLLHN